MDKIVEILEKHREMYASYESWYMGCLCGWDNGYEEHNDGYKQHLAEEILKVVTVG